jgi:hypothetical protein
MVASAKFLLCECRAAFVEQLAGAPPVVFPHNQRAYPLFGDSHAMLETEQLLFCRDTGSGNFSNSEQ